MENIEFIGVKSEIGAGTRGASLGPDALEIASINASTPLFKSYPLRYIAHENQALYHPVQCPSAKKIKSVYQVCQRICNVVTQSMEQSDRTFVISGDHSNAAGTLSGVKSAFPNQRIGAIWIDAHADLHSPYTTPSGNVHGMPVAAAFNIDNEQMQENDINKTTDEFWRKLKQLGGIAPKVHPQDFVYIAVRDTEAAEEKVMKEHNITNYEVSDIRQEGYESIVSQVYQQLEPCDKIYISFDVDSMDPSVSKGTGTPADNGITAKEADQLLTAFMEDHRVCCLEVTEINPLLDAQNAMARQSLHILNNAIKTTIPNK